jgi:hypothetical protein
MNVANMSWDDVRQAVAVRAPLTLLSLRPLRLCGE